MPDETSPTLLQYMQSIDRRLAAIDEKLDSKADQSDHDRLEERVHHFGLRVAAIAVVVVLIAGSLGWTWLGPM